MASSHQIQPLLDKPIRPQPDNSCPGHRSLTQILITAAAFSLLLLAVVITGRQSSAQPARTPAQVHGVSEKRFRVGSGSGSYPWTNAMLTWQRTAYHFQPQKNWMNDPNGPLYHLGWYHLFYQYNPDSAVWGNITWGHAVSRDLIHWLYLPIAMLPDQWYDCNGVWTGSATILPDGNITMLYTGDTHDYVQVQNLAYPANLSDPLLLHWLKYEANPVITPPKGIAPKDFRDPTTAWLGSDGLWRLALGSKLNTTGITLIYKTSNFTHFELLQDHVLHAVPATGMWECVDFFPVSTTHLNGLDTSYNGPAVKHVLKASLDDNKQDWYAIGTYHAGNDTWTPDDPELDVGIGLRVDYGKYYASKSFYDPNKGRRISWGWIGETDSEFTDLNKGWASLQTIPRTVTFDMKTQSNILQWPVEEVESLRSKSIEYQNVHLGPGSVVNLNISAATQMDISVELVVDKDALRRLSGSSNVVNKCNPTTQRGALGPFGISVLSGESLTELTPVYFYIAKGTDGKIKNWFCTDKSRSSKATDVDVEVYGGPVAVVGDENYSMRILVDHSVVEAFGQGGRTCIASRVYPTEAIYGGAKLFLFNNATDLNVTASVKAWHLSSAMLRPFPLHQPNPHLSSS